MLGREIDDTTKNRKRKTIKTVRNLFEPEEEENYYKPVRVGNLQSRGYNECESNSDRNKTLSVDKIS